MNARVLGCRTLRKGLRQSVGPCRAHVTAGEIQALEAQVRWNAAAQFRNTGVTDPMAAQYQ